MEKKSRLLLSVASLIIIISVFLFSYKQPFFLPSEINSERFSHFATFIAAILGFVTIIFLYFTFRQTQLTHQVAFDTFSETRKNYTDTKYFNLIKTHQNLVSHLHQRISSSLIEEYNILANQAGSSKKGNSFKDFFELMYGILDMFYKNNNQLKDKSKLIEYFINQEWVMGHYFTSLANLIGWILSHSEIDLNQRKFYLQVLKSQLSINELRLLFYYLLCNDNLKELNKNLSEFSFFDSVSKTLIYQDANGDWDYYKSIISN